MNVESITRSDCSWARLRAVGDQGGLPDTVRRMLGTVDEKSAREASERIEPNVRPVRMLHGAAEAVSAGIVSALGSDRVTPAGLPAALDLLVEISYRQSSVVARIEGDEGFARRCRGIIRRFLPVIHALDRADGGQRCPPGGRRPGRPSEDLGVGAAGSSEGFRAGAGGHPAGPVPGAAGGGRRGGEGTTAVRGLRPAPHGVGRECGPTDIARAHALGETSRITRAARSEAPRASFAPLSCRCHLPKNASPSSHAMVNGPTRPGGKNSNR